MDNCNQTYNSCQVVTKCQADPLTTNDIGYVGGDDICLDIKAPLTLTDVLRKIITFDKNRLFSVASTSLKVSLLPTVCDKTARIEIIPSTDANNIFVLGTDGYPFVPITVASGSLNSVTIADTNSVDLSGNGNLATPLTADVKLNPVPTNLIASTATGLLTELEVIKDIRNNLKQHVIFERPPINALFYAGVDVNGVPGPISLTKVYISNGQTYSGATYANNFTANNPDVKLFWGDTTTYENTLDNETGAGISLSHDYGGLMPSSGEIELKTYNNTYLTALKTSVTNPAISGFKFFKGADLLKSVEINGGILSTSAIMDFKNMYNVEYLSIVPTYNPLNSSCTLKNTQDLTSLKTLVIAAFIEGSPNLTVTNPTFSDIQLYRGAKGLKTIVLNNKTSLSVFTDAASVDTFDLVGSNLTTLNLNNSGLQFFSFINKIILTLNGFTPTGSMFNFSTLKNINFLSTNGNQNDGTVKYSSYGYAATPTKILMFNKLNNNISEFVKVNQDWIKDEMFISLDANGIINGGATFTIAPSIGLNFDALYYNPTWSPLNGQPALIAATQVAGIVTNIVHAGYSHEGYGYNSVPQITTTGPGTGLVTTTIMQIKNFYNVQAMTSIGSAYIVGNNYNFIGAGSSLPVIIRVDSINGTGGITGFSILDTGEFTATPSSISNANGAVYTTTNLFGYKRSIINNGGTGYTDATIYKLEVSTANGTGSGTASIQAKAAIESLHQKGWNLLW